MDEVKKIVLPGEKVFDAPQRFEGTFVESGRTHAAVVSLLHGDRITPLKGFYLPKIGDMVIGIVKEETFGGYRIDINSPYGGVVSPSDRGRGRGMRGGRGYGGRGYEEEREAHFNVGDVVMSQIESVDEVKNAILARPTPLQGGEILEIESVKVPRVIGKNASMLNLIKECTKSYIIVGNNGRVYLKGGNTTLASLAILKICEEAHLSGLTDRMKAFFDAESKRMRPTA
jgi:exosome complex component RRP4